MAKQEIKVVSIEMNEIEAREVVAALKEHKVSMASFSVISGMVNKIVSAFIPPAPPAPPAG